MANEVAKTKKREYDEFSEAFNEATIEYNQKKGKESAADVCFRVGMKHNLSPTRQGKLTARRVKEAVLEKWVGDSPLKPGRKKRSRKLPLRWRRPKPRMTPRGLPSSHSQALLFLYVPPMRLIWGSSSPRAIANAAGLLSRGGFGLYKRASRQSTLIEIN